MKKQFLLMLIAAFALLGSTWAQHAVEDLTPFEIPFFEGWDEASFDFNQWSFEPEQGNWEITSSTQYSNPAPAAKFDWDPQVTNYSYLLQSWTFDGTAKTDKIFVSFDLYLMNFDFDAVEEMDFEVYDGTSWHVIAHWDNQGGTIPWTAFGFEISEFAVGNIFRIGFRAYGEDTFSINGWAIDNISIGYAGDIAGTVLNTNTSDPVEAAMVTVSSETKDLWTGYTNAFGEFLAPDLTAGLYDILVTDDEYYPTLVEDVIVLPGATTTVDDINLDPIAPVLLVAQYNDQQITLEWEKIPENPIDNINGTIIIANTEMYEPGQTLDLDLSFIYNSEDFELICGFFMDFPAGVTVNLASDLEGNPVSSYLSFNGETGDGVICTWGIPNGECGIGSLYSSGDFVVNISIAEDFPGLLEIPYTIYGDGTGVPIHEVSGTVDVPTYEFNVYRSIVGRDMDFEFIATVMGFFYVDQGLTNRQEYCYYVTQILPDINDSESQPSNILCETPNEPPSIEIDPLTFYELINPNMIVTRIMNIANNTGSPLNLDFIIGVGAEPPAKTVNNRKFPEATGDDVLICDEHYNYIPTDDNMECPEESVYSLLPDMIVTGGPTSEQGPDITCYQYIDASAIFDAIGFWGLNMIDTTGWEECGTEDPMPFQISFYEDNAGVPGTLLYSENVTLNRFETGELVFGLFPLYYYEATLSTAVSMTNGWISILGLTSDNDCWFIWKGASQGEANPYLKWDGIEFSTGTYPLSICLGGTMLPPDEWLSVDPVSGIVAPGNSFNVDVIFNSIGLGVGYYTNDLHIYSNDLNNPVIVVPVDMEITQPSLNVDAGLHLNTLTITPIYENKSFKNIEGSTLTAAQTMYIPGETTTWNLQLYNDSFDVEWLDSLEIQFPAGVTLTGATNFDINPPIPDRYLAYGGTTGDSALVWWNDPDGEYGEIYGHETAFADVYIVIDAEFTGPLDLDYTIYGDGWGADPHQVSGTYTLIPDLPVATSFNIYRDEILIQEFWVSTIYIDEPLESDVEYCYTVTQNYFPPSAHSLPACGTPFTYGDNCEVALEYAVVDDPTVSGTTTSAKNFVWYSVENPETQDFYVSLCGSNYNTRVAVYQNCEGWDGEFPDEGNMHGAIAYNDNNLVCYQGDSTSYQSLTHLNWAAPQTYFILIWGADGDYGDYALTIFGEQSNTTKIGWTGISSYADLETNGASMEEVFEDVNPQLTILINEIGIYWPGENINTIGDFDTYSGHKAKWNDITTWIVEGEIVDDRTITFAAGTHFLPVLNVIPLAVQGFITQATQIEFMFDIDYMLIYWPDGGITPGVEGSLEYLFPGSAYLFRCNSEVTFDFTPYAPSSYSVTIPQDYFRTFENNTPWNDVLNTGSHHVVAIGPGALESLEAGDYVGTFNIGGLCTGMQLYTGEESTLPIPVNGNDFTTTVIDGMIDQELMNYKIYREGQVYDITVSYNPNMPNYDGLFNVNGLSQIIDIILGPMLADEDPMHAILIYPNPSSGVFNIDFPGNKNTMKMEVLNLKGQIIYNSELNSSSELDLSAQPQGVYFIRLINAKSVYLEKVVVK